MHLAVDFAAAGIRDVECLFPDQDPDVLPVRDDASIKEVEYESLLAEIGAWERRFLVAQA